MASCLTVAFLFVFHQALWLHRSRYHSDVKRYRCDQCPMAFHYLGALKRHLLTHGDTRFLKYDNRYKNFYKKKKALENMIPTDGDTLSTRVRKKKAVTNFPPLDTSSASTAPAQPTSSSASVADSLPVHTNFVPYPWQSCAYIGQYGVPSFPR